jgi:hypothetical protein
VLLPSAEEAQQEFPRRRQVNTSIPPSTSMTVTPRVLVMGQP